jgi:hypothetical protein
VCAVGRSQSKYLEFFSLHLNRSQKNSFPGQFAPHRGTHA